MTAKRDLRETTFKAEHRIAALFGRFGRAVTASVGKHAENGKVTPKARILILQDVDRLLDAIYPTHQGGPSVLEELIVSATTEVNLKPVAAEVGRIERLLKDDPALLDAMKAGR